MAAGDLTTLASVREYLQLSAGQTDTDALLSTFITQASQAIMRWTGREFAPQSAATTRKFRYEGGGVLRLAPYTLASSVTPTITIDTDGSTPSNTALTVDDYRLEPRNAPDGVYTHIELRNFGPSARTSSVDYWRSRQVSITGTWGYASVPDDVKLAANIAVGFLMRNHSALPAHDLGEDMPTRFGTVVLPTGALRLLDHYRVIGV